MNLAKDFAAVSVKQVRCQICDTLTSLDSKDREALQAAIGNQQLSVRVILEVCEKNGVAVNESGIYKHRHGRCKRA